jgi:hypothetical protein
LLARRLMGEIVQQTTSRFWPNAGIGFLTVVAVPVAAVLVAFTIIGIPVTIVALMAYALLMFASWVVSGAVAGQLACRYVTAWKTRQFDWPMVVGGTVALHVVAMIPLVGTLICFVFHLAALGVMTMMIWNRLRHAPAKA